jgi:CheY-like chemotaxis protein/two-component sensor histidine kinase
MPANSSINHLAHDLNNIFTRILNSIDLLKKKTANYDEVAGLISSIENGTIMASEILEDLFTDPSKDAGRKRRLNLNSLIMDIIGSLKIHFKEKIEVSLKLEPALFDVEGRYSDFYRVLMNLIINSTEAIKEKGSIRVSTVNIGPRSKTDDEPKLFDGGPQVQIKVADNGEGIDPSVIQFIFDENFTTKTKKKNRGFGLAFVKKIVDEYNGMIKVSSEKGKGTEFVINLPAIIPLKLKEEKEKKTILIAEDEDILRELLTELLESYNYNVVATGSGAGIIEQVGGGLQPDILLIDQKMPDMDGFSCIKELRKMKIQVPIIFASGSQNENIDVEELSKNVSTIIKKPYNFDEILLLIRRFAD